MLKKISNFYKNLWKSFVDKISRFFIALLNFLYELLFYTLTLLKYVSFFAFMGFLIYFFKPYNYFIVNNSSHISVINKDICNFFSKDYLRYEGYLLKHYIYTFKKNNICIKNHFQKIKFYMNGNYYDENAHIIKNIRGQVEIIEDMSIYMDKAIKVLNLPTNKNIYDGFKIYNYIRNIERIFGEENVKITLNYVYFRWDIIINYEDKFYIIKLPENITENTVKKIKHMESNIKKYFNKEVKIVDLRFEGIIVIV